MATQGWKNFALNDNTSSTSYPKNLMLLSRDTVYETQRNTTAPNSTAYARNTTAQLTVNCNLASTIATGSDFELFEAQSTMSSPKYSIGNTDNTTSSTTLDTPSGNDWQIERITLTANMDGTARVDISLVDRVDFA